MPQARDQPALGLERAIAHGAELLEHLHHPQEFLPVRVAKRLERLAPLGESLAQPLDVTPGLIATRRRAPRTPVTLDRAKGRLRALPAIALDHLAEVEAFELTREVPQPARVAAPIARDRDRRCRPENLLERAGLEPHDGAVGQQRVHQHAVAADRVDAEDHGETRRAFAADQRETSRLGLDDAALPGAGAASGGPPPRLHLLARATIAPDAREVAAGRREGLGLGERALQPADLGLDLANPLEILVLTERGLDAPPQRRGFHPGGQEQGDGPVAQLELALDRLRRAVHDADHVFEAVARVERDDALAFRVDPSPAGASRHLSQLVVGQRPESALGALGQSLQHHRARRHVDAEAHRLGGEDDLAEAALEEPLDEPLEARQDARVVETDAEPQRSKHRLVQLGVADRGALLPRLADGAVDGPLLLGREQRPALGQDVLERALAADPAEDEVDRGEPPASFHGLDQHHGIDDAPRVPAAALVGAVTLVADDARAAGPHL